MSELSIGSDYEINTFALTTADVTVTFTRAIKSFSMQCRDDVDVLIRRNTADSVYWTLKAGSTFSAEINRSNRSVATTVAFCRIASGTATLEVLVSY